VIVADASLITYFIVRNDHSELADAVCATDGLWAAPLLWRSEVRNTLGEYVQRDGMSIESAMISMQVAEEVISGREYAVDSRKVLELAAQSKCTASECEYVALAQDLGVPLVTTDKQLIRAFPKTAVALEKFIRNK
jgi:predicted nucleic acid-binding protein